MNSGDTFTHEGLEFTFDTSRDDCHGAPWDEEDGHGEVSDWTRRDKSPGEMILCEDRGAKRFYDFAGAVKTARKEGWDAAPYGGTQGEKAARAAMADFDRLRRWCSDDWQYVGVIVTCLDLPGNPEASLWGIESDAGEYLAEVARDLADELIETAAREIAKAAA